MHRESVRRARIDIVAEPGEQPRHVRRTTGATEPGHALRLHEVTFVAAFRERRHDFERVDVEIGASIEREAGQDVVVERALHHVRIFAPPLEFQQAPRAKHHADRRAGLGIGPVRRQVEGLAEFFPVGFGSDSARDIQMPLLDRGPEPATLRGERFVRPLARKVDHRREEIHHAHRVADRFVQLAHRLRSLQRGESVMVHVPRQPAVFAPPFRFRLEIVRRSAALPEEVGGEVAITLLSRGARQLQQRQLDLLVAAVTLHPVRPRAEGAIDQVREPANDLEQPALAGRLEVGDARLDEMTGHVEFVAIPKIRPAVLRLDEREVGVEVAVRLLRLRDRRDQPVEFGVERRIGVRAQPVARRLDPLREVGILPEKAVEPPFLLARRHLEIMHAAAALRARDAVVERLPLPGNRRLAHDPRAAGEESVVERNRRERQGGSVAHARGLTPVSRGRRW